MNYLTGFTPAVPPAWYAPDEPYVTHDGFNLAPVLAGSEGTLVVIRRARMRLVPRPAATVLLVLPFPSTVAACDAVPELLRAQPAAMELFPGALLEGARRVPTLARRISFVTPEAAGPEAALLVAEFTGDTPAEALAAAGRLHGRGRVLVDPAQQADLWAVRAGGMGIITNIPGDLRPLDFIEDVSVPVEHLGEYVQRMDAHPGRARHLPASGTPTPRRACCTSGR